MEDRTAFKLAESMHGTWPTTGPNRAAWYDLLQTLDEPTARAAFHVVRSSSTRFVLGSFNEEYAAIRRRVVAAPDQRARPCTRCEGTGLVSAPPERAHNPRHCRPTEDYPCSCSATEACGCAAGRPMVGMLARAVEHNDRGRAPFIEEPTPETEPQPAEFRLPFPADT